MDRGQFSGLLASDIKAANPTAGRCSEAVLPVGPDLDSVALYNPFQIEFPIQDTLTSRPVLAHGGEASILSALILDFSNVHLLGVITGALLRVARIASDSMNKCLQ